MTDIVAFLKARLDEDEHAAQLVRQPYRLYVSAEGRLSEPRMDEDGNYVQWAEGEDRMPNHITNWGLVFDPARVLREVEAKRRTVGRYERLAAEMYTSAMDEDRAWTLLPALIDLASVYDGHPDYDESWRP